MFPIVENAVDIGVTSLTIPPLLPVNSRSQYAQQRIDSNWRYSQNDAMRSVEFGKALAAGTRLTLFSRDKPDRFFTVIKYWIDQTLGASREFQDLAFFPTKSNTRKAEYIYYFSCQSRNRMMNRCYLWRQDQAGLYWHVWFDVSAPRYRLNTSQGVPFFISLN